MRLVFDIETNAVDFSDGNWLERITDVWCIIAYDLDTNQWHSWAAHQSTKLAQVIRLLKEADELIGHNIIQFDIPVLKKIFNLSTRARIRDTLVESRVLYPDRPGGHSLDAWGERLSIPKGDSPSFEKYSPEMLEYCRQDVRVNTELFKRLRTDTESNRWDRALRLEHRIAEIIAEQERVGFYFYKDEAQELVDDWISDIRHIDMGILSGYNFRISHSRTVNKPFKLNGEPTVLCAKALQEVSMDSRDIGGPFCTLDYTKPDLNSKPQQKELLLELGWQPKEFTPTGQPKLGPDIKEIGPIGESLHRRNALSHRLSQVSGLIDLTDQNSRVHGGANPCGTPTARMRHSRIVNIPRVTTAFGKEIRSLFGVPEGKFLLGYDASGIELRMLAHYIGNEEYIKTVIETDKTKDAHTLAALAAYRDVLKREDYDIHEIRNDGKTINYAMIYGAGNYKLGTIIGGGVKEGRELRAALYDKIPGLKQLIDRIQRASKRGYMIGIDGRKLYTRSQNSALNTLLQGSHSIFMKTVTERLDRLTAHMKRSFKVVDMHDEAQWEVIQDDIEDISNHIHDSFEYVTSYYELKCPQEAEISIGKSWAETH